MVGRWRGARGAHFRTHRPERFSFLAERGIRVKASSLGREFSKPRLCKQLGDFRPASVHQLEASDRAAHRYSPIPPTVAQSLWDDYTQLLNQARVQRQHAWSGYRDSASRERRRFEEKRHYVGTDSLRASQGVDIIV